MLPILRSVLRKRFGRKPFQWLVDPWDNLKGTHEALDDREFLAAFEPIANRFRERGPYLERVADAVAQVYPPTGESSAKRKILEIASGCDVFPEILRSRGYEAIGLDAAPIVVRYCRLKGIEIIDAKTWDRAPWTPRKFDVLILICYITAPNGGEWSNQMLHRLCENVVFHLHPGTDFLLFDLRYFRPLMRELRRLKVRVKHEKLTKAGRTFHRLSASG